MLELFGLSYSQNSLFLEKAWMYRPYFFSFFFLLTHSTYATICFLNWFPMIVSIKKRFSCKYNPSRRFNVRFLKSNNIQLCFIKSSFWNSMSYLSRLRAIIYCSKNSSLLAIIMHSLLISNGLLFLGEGPIHFSYSTFANQYGSLICVKYTKNISYLQHIKLE